MLKPLDDGEINEAHDRIILLQAGIPWDVVDHLHPKEIRTFLMAYRRVEVQRKLDNYEAFLLSQSVGDHGAIIERWRQSTYPNKPTTNDHSNGLSVEQYMRLIGNS